MTVPRVEPGQSIQAGWANQLVNSSNRVDQMTGTSGVAVKHTEAGITISNSRPMSSAGLGIPVAAFGGDQGNNAQQVGEFVSVRGIWNDVDNALAIPASGLILKTDTYDEGAAEPTPKIFGVVTRLIPDEDQGEVVVAGLALALCDAAGLTSTDDGHGVLIRSDNRTGFLVKNGGDFPVMGVSSTAVTGTLHWCLIDLSGNNINTGMVCYNGSGATIPNNSIVEVTGPHEISAVEQEGWYDVDKCTAEDLFQAVIVPFAIEDTKSGLCFFPGDTDRRAWVEVDGSPAIGDEIGTETDNWKLKTGQAGFKVISTLGGGAYVRPFRLRAIAAYGYIYAGDSGSRLQDCDGFDAVGNSWTNKTNLPSPARDLLAASTISSKGYVYGGSPSAANQLCDEFNAAGNSWANRANLPSPGRTALAASTISDKGYIYGGSWASRYQDCDEYNAGTNSWAGKTDLPSPVRDGLAASTISSKGYVYGGYSGAYEKVCDEFDAVGNSWTGRTDLPSPARRYLAASTISDKGYIFGGDDTGAEMSDCDEFNAVGNSWASKTSLPAPSRDSLAASTISDKGYIYGGYGSSAKRRDCDEFNAAGNTWANKADIPLPARNDLAASTV